MIYPEITGKSGEHLRLNTLEAVWIQGKLRMWGAVVVYRWGVNPEICLTGYWFRKKLTKTAVNEVLRSMKKSGLEKPELEAFFSGYDQREAEELVVTLYRHRGVDY